MRMEKKFLWLGILTAVLSFVGGFFVANSLNRGELSTLRAENERLKASSPQGTGGSESELSTEEIRQRIAEADANPADHTFQRNLGLALYRYAAAKQDTELLGHAARFLQRADSLKSGDYDVIVALGNAHFDIGYFKQENKPFETARSYYAKALAQKPDDVDVRTDVGLSYFLQQPPDDDKAAAEFKKSLETNPNHEKSLNFLIQSLIRQNKLDEAKVHLETFRQSNPNSQAVAQLSAQISSGVPAK